MMGTLMQGPVQPLFQSVMQRLSGQDQDQEVKECAISCMASIIACLGDVLLPEVPQALRVSQCCACELTCPHRPFRALTEKSSLLLGWWNSCSGRSAPFPWGECICQHHGCRLSWPC